MSWRISTNGDIIMTRGDTPSIKIGVNVKDEEDNLFPYEPIEGDTIVFAVKKSIHDTDRVLTKIIPNDTKILSFKEEDTKNLDFGTYVYEISLNSGDYHCTFKENLKLKITAELY